MEMGKIQELPKSSSSLLTSSQIISSVYCVVKELIENAFDSSAKNVEIKLENYGLDKIEIKDNGCGIEKNDIQFVARPHFTSKITSYLDLNNINGYGFRGEALGAICAVADLVITTKTSEENIGSISSFKPNGEVMSNKPAPCATGTVISVHNLFKNIPVRKQYYRSDKNKKDELRKVEDLLIAYGCIQHDVRLALYHNKNLIWQKSPVSNTKNALIQVLGNSVVDHMEYITHVDEPTLKKIEAFLPKVDAPLTCGFSTSCRSITVVNNRPVRIKEIDKLLKEYYNKSIENTGRAKYPICYVSFSISPSEIDVNIEPNKTSIMLHNLDEIHGQFSEMLREFYTSNNASTSKHDEPVSSANLSSNQESTSVTSNFLNTLKMNCDSKIIQATPASDLVGNCISKKDISIISDSCNNKFLDLKNRSKSQELKEPSKKKIKTNFQSSQKDVSNHINTINTFFAKEDKIPFKNENHTLYDPNCMSVTVQRCSSDITSDVSNINLNVVNKNSKITTFTVSSDENIKSILPANANRKRHLSESSALNIQIDENFKKRPVVVTQNENMWSRGVHASGKLIQPVCILKPELVARSPLKNAEENHDTEQNISLPEKTLSFERKLTAFDVFCRNNRLEVAAQNPEFSNHQIAQILSEKWSRLSPEEKAIHKNMITKDYPKEIKNKERLSRTIAQNLIQNKKTSPVCKISKKEVKPKLKSKAVLCDIQQISAFLNNPRCGSNTENLMLINHLASGVWICVKNEKLFLLNTFRLQETIIYQRLLATFQFESEKLDIPQRILPSELGDEAFSILKQLKNVNGNVCDERLISNGLNVKITSDENNQVLVELIGKTKVIAFYGTEDLKEILLQIKQKSSAELSECRPGTVILFLQSEANRMSRQSPIIQRMEDVQYLLSQKEKLPSNCNDCLHNKPFFHELWQISKCSTQLS